MVCNPINQRWNINFILLRKWFGKLCYPTVQKNSPAHRFRLHIDHTTSRNSCRRSGLKIHRLKDKIHRSTHGNNLTRVKTKFFIIIKHSIHIFNPNSINRPIENQPFSIGILWFCKLSELDCKDTISPLMWYLVTETIELFHRNRFGIDDKQFCFVLIHLISFFEESQSTREDFNGTSFSWKR